MGSAACYHLARRGKRVLGLERYDIPHAMGSSHGVNRIIRLGYYEHPSYVPLLRRAYELWRELEAGFGERLLHITGSIDAGPADSQVFVGSRESCELHGLPHEVLTSAELTERHPGYRLLAGHMAVYQPEGGFVMSERAIVAYVAAALELGAKIHGRERVLGWEETPAGVRVVTDRGVYEAEQLVVAAGAWMGALVPELEQLAVPERQVLGWFQPARPAEFAPDRFPVFNLTVDEGRYYGFPVHSVPGFKIGRYHHLDEVVDPDDWDREPNAADEAVLREVVARYFPEADGPALTLRSCLFTNTPDEHFILDRPRGDSPVVVASPCSGHGFKFSAVVGELIAGMVVDGEASMDIGLFRLGRFG
jgi:sarcosine oxidase